MQNLLGNRFIKSFIGENLRKKNHSTSLADGQNPDREDAGIDPADPSMRGEAGGDEPAEDQGNERDSTRPLDEADNG